MSRDSRSNLVDVDDVKCIGESAAGLAWRIQTADAREIWLPKSQVEKNDDGSFTMPHWLAEREGLI